MDIQEWKQLYILLRLGQNLNSMYLISKICASDAFDLQLFCKV